MALRAVELTISLVIGGSQRCLLECFILKRQFLIHVSAVHQRGLSQRVNFRVVNNSSFDEGWALSRVVPWLHHHGLVACGCVHKQRFIVIWLYRISRTSIWGLTPWSQEVVPRALLTRNLRVSSSWEVSSRNFVDWDKLNSLDLDNIAVNDLRGMTTLVNGTQTRLVFNRRLPIEHIGPASFVEDTCIGSLHEELLGHLELVASSSSHLGRWNWVVGLSKGGITTALPSASGVCRLSSNDLIENKLPWMHSMHRLLVITWSLAVIVTAGVLLLNEVLIDNI